jgi:predicted CoA-binding protein
MDTRARIRDFLDGGSFAVVGASPDRSKFGNRVLRCYLRHGRETWPVNPHHAEVEGRPCVASLDQLPAPVHGVSVITPPAASLGVLEEAARLGLTRVWLQPGAEDAAVLARAAELGLEAIAGGPCLLVELDREG